MRGAGVRKVSYEMRCEHLEEMPDQIETIWMSLLQGSWFSDFREGRIIMSWPKDSRMTSVDLLLR